MKLEVKNINIKKAFILLFLFFCLAGTVKTSEAHILIIGDSASDFPISYQETSQLAADLRQRGYQVLDLYRDDATAENILKGMYGADAVIYAGHGGYQSGNYNNAGGIANPPFSLVGSDDFIWGIGNQMREGWDSDLFTAPFKSGIPVFLLHACFSTGWVEDNQVANPTETIYNFAQMFTGADANYYATAWNGAEIIYDFLNGASNFQDANNQNYEKITTSTLYNGVEIWRNNNGYAAFVGDWNGQFPSASQTTVYNAAAAEAWYNSNRVLNDDLYVNANQGNDSWDGTSPTFMGGTKGPMKTITAALSAIKSWGTILVASGNYNENLVINQQVNLLGSGFNSIITSSNPLNPIINITGGGNGSTISGFVLKSATSSSAIVISGASTCTIKQNNITGNQIGVLVSGNNNSVSDNNISGNTVGVYIGNKTKNNSITGNQINGSTSSGVYCEGGNNHTLKDNTITQGTSGVTVKNSKDVKIEENRINSNNGTGISVQSSNNTTIQRNSISSNQDGIVISENSCKNLVADNSITNNKETGVKIQKSQNNTIYHNNIQNNLQKGIDLNQSTGNMINGGNTISGSNVAIVLQNNSNNNTINGNTISANYSLITISNSSNNVINNNQINQFSVDQIISASLDVKNYIELNKSLPSSIKVSGISINLAQFLHLAVQATIQLKTGNNGLIQIKNDNLPGFLEEQLSTGNLNQESYLDFAQRINGHMNDNLQAPPYGYIGLGKIGYKSQIYLFARILSVYNSTGALPTYVTVKPWSAQNIPILYVPPVTFTPVQIAAAAVSLQNTIESTKSIPSTVVVNGVTIYTAQFLHLATQATSQLKNNNHTPILLQNDEKPGYSEESLNSGTMTLVDYLDFAQRITGHMNDNHQAPPYGFIGLGKISYQSQVYLFTRVLSIYNSTGSLPLSVTVKPWSAQNIPILYVPPVTFTPVQIAAAAVSLQNTIESTKSIPSTVVVNGVTIYTAQFLHLATQATSQLKNNNHTPILLQNDEKPGYSEESLNSGTMTLVDYLDFAQRITGHMNDNHQAPPYGFIGLGKISYQSQVYLFTRVLSIYNSTGSLPAYVTMKPFTTSNIPILYTPPVTFTPQQIVTAALTLQNTIETTKTIPNTVTVNGISIYVAQFLHLATQATVQLKNNNTNPILLQNDEKPGFIEESLNSGGMTIGDYLDFAQRITSHMDQNHQAPPYGYIGLGKIGYSSQVYLYVRILSIYNSTGTLPPMVTLRPWTAQNIPILYVPPVTFTHQQIVTTAIQLKNTIESTKAMPQTVNIGANNINVAQFLHLATNTILSIKNNNYGSMLLPDDTIPEFSEEQLTAGSLSQEGYLDFAQRISNHMNDNHQAPPYGYIGLGKISYMSQIYLFSSILSSYNSSGNLPASITVKPWVQVISPDLGDPTAMPVSTTKLVFIHHSCGSNWLANGNGNLGTVLNSNNYYVTETNYGWDAQSGDNLGDRTDTGNWPEWFTDQKMPYVYNNNYHSAYTNIIANPGGENDIIMFKSCYPLSEVGSSINDEKNIYNSLKTYFAAHPNKLFVLITPPGETTVSSYPLTRELCNWLVDRQNGWLNDYAGKNVFVFDFYAVLSETNSHHRWMNGGIEYVYASNYDGVSPYHNGDNHPTATGNQKATDEFIELLNYAYNQWKTQ